MNPRTVRALVVDDSAVYRRLIATALNRLPYVEVCAQAGDGAEALECARRGSFDLVTLDLEMPQMSGVECVDALRHMGSKARVLVFSSLTRASARKALQALANGADDYVNKPSATEAGGAGTPPVDMIFEALNTKIQGFFPNVAVGPGRARDSRPAVGKLIDWAARQADVIVVASSTGGPVALERMLGSLQGSLSCPMLIAQHMPRAFTAALAERLASQTKLNVSEGQDKEALAAGKIYVCPGDYHMRLSREGTQMRIRLAQDERRNFVRPSADYLFEAAAQLYTSRCLGVVLTGMGADGRDGALAIKASGGRVTIQEEKSCVVYGMPKAVQEANAYDEIADLQGIARIMSLAGGGYSSAARVQTEQ